MHFCKKVFILIRITYTGALCLYPPRNQSTTLITRIYSRRFTKVKIHTVIFLSQNIIDTVKLILGGNNIKNIRPVQRTPQGVSIFYNANSQFDTAQDMSSAETLETTPTPSVSNNLQSGSWLKRNIYYIKGIIITIVLLLMIYVAIKTASIIVKNDLLNGFIIRQLKHREERQVAKAQEQMRQQQIAESGGIEPVQKTNINNLKAGKSNRLHKTMMPRLSKKGYVDLINPNILVYNTEQSLWKVNIINYMKARETWLNTYNYIG